MALTIDHLLAPHDHVVHFYGDDEELSDGVVAYLAEAIEAGGLAIVIATEAHRRAFAERLPGGGEGVIWADAGEYMASLLVHGTVARHRFDKLIGDLVREAVASAGGRPVRAYGEIVALLWARGQVTAALDLERLWNELGREAAFSLYCAYPRAAVEGEGVAWALSEVCRQHSAVPGPTAGPPPWELSRTFAPVGSGSTEARRFVTGALASWGQLALVDDAAVIVAELAANAVLHARTGFTVTVSRLGGGTIRISVHDASLRPPRPRRPAPLDGSGRGLGLVAALASAWGCDIVPGGKAVWAELVS